MNRQREEARRLEDLAWLLDSAIRIPGLGLRFGLDAILGLFPGFGDALGALASSWIIAAAGRLGAPRAVLLKMAFNVAFDTLIGTIPLLGDLFDFGWKANLRNVRLLQAYLERPGRTAAVSRAFVWGLLFLVVAAVLGIMVLGILAVRWLWLAVSG